MKLSEMKEHLEQLTEINFRLPTGCKVPSHFHVTEIGLISKHFMDCGGTERTEKVISLQLWNANDTAHKLLPKKLLSIIELSEQKLGLSDLEIELEYQSETIGKYGLKFNGSEFELITKKTACLALDACGVLSESEFALVSNLQNGESCCTPNSKCC